MAPRWVGFLVFVWVMAALAGSVGEGQVLIAGNTTLAKEAMGPVQGMMYYTIAFQEMQGWGQLLELPAMSAGFFGHLFRMLLLDFPIFGAADSPWQLVRWIVLAPIIATIVFGLVVWFLMQLRRTV